MNPVNSVLCYFIYAKIFTCPNFSFVEKVYDKFIVKMEFRKNCLNKKNCTFYVVYNFWGAVKL